ncbi:7043_t:CDS:2, partial [Scutellospora calospora]
MKTICTIVEINIEGYDIINHPGQSTPITFLFQKETSVESIPLTFIETIIVTVNKSISVTVNKSISVTINKSILENVNNDIQEISIEDFLQKSTLSITSNINDLQETSNNKNKSAKLNK